MIIKNEVKQALDIDRPIVALESTLIAHGLPYPENIKIGKELEKIIRDEGVMPATIAIIKGEIHIGLTDTELEFIAKEKDVWKLSTREIPICMAQKRTGATTVSATSYIAHKIGISLFSTGGIGGVHREVAQTWDISRDLEELSETEIIVVSAGAKSILDLPKTVEYLETKGVMLVGYKTDEFPAFHTRKSGIPIPRVDTFEEIVNIYKYKKELGIKGALLVTNPIPQKDEIPYEKIDMWVKKSLEMAHSAHIEGKKVTPFLLDSLARVSNGESVTANLSLLKANAGIAAKIAKALKNA